MGEVIQHFSKVIISLTSSLLNNTNLSFCLLLYTLTLAYQLLNVNPTWLLGRLLAMCTPWNTITIYSFFINPVK